MQEERQDGNFSRKGGSYTLQQCVCCWPCIAITPSRFQGNFGLFLALLTGGETLFEITLAHTTGCRISE